ncbi:MAG: MATE family efflux transporter [Thiohalocapsa sp.]
MTAERIAIRREIRATVAVAAPLAAANLAQMAMQVTNTVMVAHLGAVPLAAAGLGAALYATLLMTSQGLLTAVAPLAAHALGAGDRLMAGQVATGGLVVAAMLAAPAIALLVALPPLLQLLGYDAPLVTDIGRFLVAISWGVPPFLGAAVLRFLLIAAFRTRIVMIVPMLAVPANIGLNWLLVFGHGGLPALGAVGSASATAIVQWLTLASFGGYMLLVKMPLGGRSGRAVLRPIRDILRIGLPIAAMRGLEIGVFVMTGIMMGVVGADALAAHQLVINVAGVCFMVPLGLSQAATVRVAHQLGLGAPAAARRAAFTALALGALFMTLTASVLWSMPRLLVGLYLDLADPGNQAVVATALRLFAVAALFQLFDGVQVIAAGALRGYRDTAVPMVIAAVGYWAIGFAGGLVAAFPLGYGAAGLWLGLALGLASVAIALSLRLRWRAQAPFGAAPRPALATGGAGA